MTLLRWICAYLFDCVHTHTTWPHQDRFGHAYVCCLDCGREMPYSLEYMQIVALSVSSGARAKSTVAKRILAGILLLGTIFASQEIATAGDPSSRVNVEEQTTCESQMLANMQAQEVFSGRAYDVLTEVARAYGRAIPHIYIFPGSWNMAYIAASIAVDGRGKILVGQQATDLFDTAALKGFLGHEMAHLVSDTVAQGCNDYIVRDPKMEADADALAARTIGRRPVNAFLERALALTENQNWDARRRLEILQRFQFTKVSEKPNDDTRIR
jgi:Zn-dependent protease with chaperone function